MRTADVLHKVDPNLTIITSHHHRVNNDKYELQTTYHITNDDWNDGAGKRCSSCGRESFRLVGDMCLKCNAEEAYIKEINQLTRTVTPEMMLRSYKVGQHKYQNSCYYEMADPVTDTRWMKQVY